ncbi:hypothetical protein [Paraburkholderia sp. J11-2]|uniref:alpha/beta hydrolase n=1 Tax=Paraburkholderia sp. J11-2 TaxID=2805431 RepID=UPI002AB77A0E|nr:hypothetical protein [Paraburkholderia sp. J11-2]
MKKIEERLEIGAVVGQEGIASIAVTIFLPDVSLLPARPVVMFAFPGSGYSRGYFDLHMPGHSHYSQAEYHCQKGCIFVAVDHLGVGESVVTNPEALRIEQVVQANHETVQAVLKRLASADVAPGFPRVVKPLCVGAGQSMGGAFVIAMQGRCRTFDAIAVLGYSVPRIAIPAKDGFVFAEQMPTQDQYRFGFHWDDEPEEVVRVDFAGGYPIRQVTPAFGSKTRPGEAIRFRIPNVLGEDAARIAQPVFLAFGERDVSLNPHADPASYTTSRDVSLNVISCMAHMHNFASTREILWSLLQAWVQRLAGDL